MVFVKIISVIFFLIPDSVIMIIAYFIFPFFYRAMRKGKWGLKTAKIIPKVFMDKSQQWQRSVIKKNALHLMKFAGEMFKAHYKRDFWLMKKCFIKEGKSVFEDLLQQKRGFIILTCHLGNWEYAAAWLAMHYKRLYAPVFVENSEGNRALNWIRQGHNIELLAVSRNPRISAQSLLKMIKLLENGEIIYLVGDQAALGGEYRGKFFGKELRVFGGPFILGKKTGRSILPLYSIREKDNRIGLHFEAPFKLDGNDVEKDITRVNDFFERNIAKYPEQYLWSQDRW